MLLYLNLVFLKILKVIAYNLVPRSFFSFDLHASAKEVKNEKEVLVTRLLLGITKC